ncbi:MAG: hypothetical protein ABEJ40_08550 [Haloarculaceae archaeon]
MRTSWRRRTLLRTAGAAGLAALGGCLGGGDDNSTDGDEGGTAGDTPGAGDDGSPRPGDDAAEPGAIVVRGDVADPTDVEVRVWQMAAMVDTERPPPTGPTPTIPQEESYGPL